jgi:TonB family protein
MLEQLSASRAARRIPPGRVFLAAALHGAVIFGAVKVTGKPADQEAPRRVDLIQVAFHSPDPEPETSAPEQSELAAAPSLDAFLTPPVDVPPAIPLLVPGPAIDLASLRRSTTAADLLRATAPVRSSGLVLASGDVDEPAAVIRQPSPRYPPVLQQAGFEGRVMLEFIIDTTGHPEPASLRVIERSRDGFDAAALETIEHSLFRPARVGGRPVRQRTLQWVVFRIAPD